MDVLTKKFGNDPKAGFFIRMGEGYIGLAFEMMVFGRTTTYDFD
jgi:hypothetical protein